MITRELLRHLRNDLPMSLGYDFKTTVSILLLMYDQHRSRLSQTELPTASN